MSKSVACWCRVRAGLVTFAALPAIAALAGAAVALEHRALTAARDQVPAPADQAGSLAGVLQRLSRGATVVDLTHPLGPDSLYWPTGSPFEHKRLTWGVTPAGYWYAAASFCSAEHLGTHLDAPIHFADRGWTTAEIPVESLVAPGIVIDITARSAANPDATLQPADLVAWERERGRIPAGAIVIVRSGWATRWPDWQKYYGSGNPKDVATLHFPGVSRAAASALVDRRVAGVGIDTASIDPGVSRTFEAHQVLAAANIFNLENLTNVAGLPPSGFLIVALPMKIAGGTGGPTRVVALVGRREM